MLIICRIPLVVRIQWVALTLALGLYVCELAVGSLVAVPLAVALPKTMPSMVGDVLHGVVIVLCTFVVAAVAVGGSCPPHLLFRLHPRATVPGSWRR